MGGLAFKEAIKAGKYVHHYTKNLEKLQAKMRDLGHRQEIIAREVCEAIGRGEEIEVDVSHWQADADKLKNDIELLIKESTTKVNMSCIAGSCPNIKRRYKYSTQAKEKIADANELIMKSNNLSNNFNQISHPRPRPSELESLSDKNYVNFDSRASFFNDIMDALKDPIVNMIGVSGLSGVGKTTLVKEVGEQMRQDGTFKQVAIAVVSTNVNVKEVQSQLADSLHFDLNATGDEVNKRATRLWQKFKKMDKEDEMDKKEEYLVILDDIWDKVDLKAIGIPLTNGKKGCKVVLTSRHEDLLRITMKAKCFRIAELPEAEAWDLFKKKVGNSIESRPEIDSLARKVCKRCKGLPVIINALGAALENKPEYTWNDASDKLEEYMLRYIQGLDPSVFGSLRVSYDMLRRLLAPRTLDRARNVVRTVVDALKSASLLTIGSHENVVKIHDIIRDVGISIAREEEAFLVDHGALRWPGNPTNGSSYSGISLIFKNIKELPNGLRLPSSLAELTNLQMLYLVGCELGDIAILKDLKSKPEGTIDEEQDTSNRNNVSLEEIWRLLNNGQLTTLYIHIPDVKLLPKEDLIFANLKRFWISVGSPLRYKVACRTCILKLGGIQLRNEFITLAEKADKVAFFGITGLNRVFNNRAVGNGFLNLKHLQVKSCDDDWEHLFGEPKSFEQSHGLHRLPPFNNLTVLYIDDCKSKYLFSSTIARGLVHMQVIEVRNCEIMEGIVGFEGQDNENEIIGEVKFSKLEKLELTCLPNLISFYAKKEKMGTTMGSSSAHAQPLFNEKVIFPVLERLTIDGLGNIIKIWDKQSIVVLEEQGSFCQLKDLEVRRCSKLMHVFPSNMHPLLKNLEKLEVKECETMKGIAEFEGEIDEDGLRNEVASPVLEHLEMVRMPKITEIRDKQPLPESKKEVESLCKLTRIDIINCSQLLYVFPSHMLPHNLQKLCIERCDKLEVIFSKESKEKEAINNDIIVFPRLKDVILDELPKLKSFYTETQGFFSHKVAFPVLECLVFRRWPKITRIWGNQPLPEPEKEAKSFCKLLSIHVMDCEHLEYVLPFYMLPQLKNLQRLIISGCTEMEVIISNNPKEKEATNNDTIRFPQLNTVDLNDLPNLKSLCSETQLFLSNKDAFPVLEIMLLRPEGTLEFLRNETSTEEGNETSTEEVSMEFALEVMGAFGLLGRHARVRWSSLLHLSAKLLVPFNKLKTHLMMMLSLFGL
ncbi:hypothetical protein RHGRI_007268 [Rhododendron griersonianum]|uniref:AAA+ ATPase domain-containing protein n=1 Tax=Rhododendron griersonianum TaxID=479676 RepID=A0AAV6KXI7_9ERIC|nr:hypothetical protein RHGRI_007268 [Rhododendron griersonianum]